MFLFNMTMPVTLWATAKIFPGAKGFAFGLLTFGLFLGFLPVYLGIEINAPRLFALFAAVSLALLWLGLRRLKL
jgi:FSR family fosmidomycin resistance protein-like MFS transporter